MRRLLLATSALCTAAIAAAVPAPAKAAPITLVVAVTATTLGVSAATAAVILNIGLSLVLAGAQYLLAPRPSAPAIKRELAAPVSRPPWRFAYGRDRLTGSPAPWRVSGGRLYGCLLLNSRPSAGGTVQVTVDKRTQTLTGDLLDFAGDGATPADGILAGHFRCWLGLGDQTGPPADILAEAPEHFAATDGWRGRTVLWVRCFAGKSGARPRRWPSVPPLIEVEADWSKVFDPRDAAQDADDPATWTWSANQALCLLDALRQNPVRRHRLADLHLASFVAGADAADVSVARHYAGTPEPRYRANGLIAWGGREIIDQIAPLVDAGAGRLVRIGSRLGYAPGAWIAPTVTVEDILDDAPLDFQVLAPGREIPSAVRAVYVSPGRDWQEAELPPRPVVGAERDPGEEAIRELRLSMVTSPTQAQRIAKIEASRLAAQKRLTCTLPPDAVELVAGAAVTVAMPAAFARLNGIYEVQSANPALFLADDATGGVALRVPVVLRETAEAQFAWNPATDEIAVASAAYSAAMGAPPQPGALTLASDGTTATGGVPRLRLAFSPVDDVDGYEWSVDPTGETDGLEDAVINRLGTDRLDGAGRVFAFFAPVSPGVEYRARVRSTRIRPTGVDVSAWRDGTITALPPDVILALPTGGGAIVTSSTITVSFTAPNSRDFGGIEIVAAAVDDVNEAVAIGGGVLYGAPRAVFSVVHTVGPSTTRYYFARSVDRIYGSTTAWTASVSATTDAE